VRRASCVELAADAIGRHPPMPIVAAAAVAQQCRGGLQRPQILASVEVLSQGANLSWRPVDYSRRPPPPYIHPAHQQQPARRYFLSFFALDFSVCMRRVVLYP
jgi:hypothetical protein